MSNNLPILLKVFVLILRILLLLDIIQIPNSEMNHLNSICLDWSNDILTIWLCKCICTCIMYDMMVLISSKPTHNQIEWTITSKCLTFQASYVQNDIGRRLESWDMRPRSKFGRYIILIYCIWRHFFYKKNTMMKMSPVTNPQIYDSATEILAKFYSVNS